MINAVVDLSHHNNVVDLEKAKRDGILGVIHKATQGLRFVDPNYETNRRKARAAGMLWGAYHFGTGDDGVAQAKHFLRTANAGANEILVLDFEPSSHGDSMSLDQARDFVRHVQDATGRAPGLYSGHYIKQLLGSATDAVLAQCWFWLAQYGPRAVVPPNWSSWALWQYTDGGVVNRRAKRTPFSG